MTRADAVPTTTCSLCKGDLITPTLPHPDAGMLEREVKKHDPDGKPWFCGPCKTVFSMSNNGNLAMIGSLKCTHPRGFLDFDFSAPGAPGSPTDPKAVQAQS